MVVLAAALLASPAVAGPSAGELYLDTGRAALVRGDHEEARIAFEQALREHEEEGGVAGRGGRYARNCRILVEGMRALGFETLLPDDLQAPIIVTFHMPADPAFVFPTFYDCLGERGFVIYPGKLTVADSFRIGCIGRLGEEEMRGALAAVSETLEQMGVTHCGPRHSDPALA